MKRIDADASTRILRVALGALVATIVGIATIVGAPTPAQAASNPTGTAIYHPITLYFYAEPGEKIDWEFEKLAGTSEVTFLMNGTNGEIENCTMTAAGTTCGAVDVITQPGIWTVRFTVDGTPSANDHLSAWSLEVLDAGDAVIPGRVWTEEYEMSNLDFTTTVDFSFWYMGEFGDLYRVDYSDFNGVNSTFLASGVGLVPLSGSSCVPQYRSSQRQGEINPDDPNPPLRPLASGECGGRYKIFFESPDLGMPATAAYWNGGSTWLVPAVVDPVVTDVSFAFDDAGSLTGDLSFRVTNFHGTLQILVDVNGDGDTDDAVDRVIPYFVSSAAPPVHTYAFDGLDGQGDPIPGEQQVTFTIAVSRAGEVHFVNTDVETRGGLQIESLRGPNAGDTRLYWDERALGGAVSAQKCSQTAVLDGRAGVATGGGPVHGWAPCGVNPVNAPPTNANNGFEGSWGDSRHIHDWTFRPVTVSAAIQVTSRAILPPTGADVAAPLIAAGALLLGGLGILGARRMLRPRMAEAGRRGRAGGRGQHGA